MMTDLAYGAMIFDVGRSLPARLKENANFLAQIMIAIMHVTVVMILLWRDVVSLEG